MVIHKKVWPRDVVCIHGIFYYVADEIIFKKHECEWILSSSCQRHIKFNPRHLPVVTENNNATATDRLRNTIIFNFS